jgi:N6-adenosine-specific RNA methylase IME4
MITDIDCVQLPIAVIRTDGGTQIRAELDQSRVEELAELRREGYEYKDPIEVYYDGTHYWLSDGFHRLAAEELAGFFIIKVRVKSGTRENAIEAACGANATHGLPRNNKDKRRAVERLLDLPKWQAESNVEIAKQCKVTEHLVRIIRNDLPEEHPASTKSRKPTNRPVERNEDNNRVGNSPSIEDRRRAVKKFLEETPNAYDLSNREIARQCGVDHKTVAAIREEWEAPLKKQQLKIEEAIEEIETVPDPEEIETKPIELEPVWQGLLQPETTPQSDFYQSYGYVYAYCASCDEISDEWELVENGWACDNCGDITLNDDMQIRETQDRYDGSKPAYCKYCYKTHDRWESAEEGWECRKCGYVTSDECMEIEGVEPSKTQKAFYEKHNDNTPTEQEKQSQIEPEPVDKPEIVSSPEELELPLPQEEVEQKPFEVARYAPAIEQDAKEISSSAKPDVSSSGEESKETTMSNRTVEISEEEALEIYKENLAKKRQQKEQMREQRRNENRQLIAQSESIDEALAAGARFSTIVIDPPWDWGDEGDADQFGRARPTYATMSIGELMAMPVGEYADEDCHIYLWITNRSLPKGFQLLDAWGFRYVTCVTWVKPHFGMGNYFRGQTEHLLFGVKGSQSLKRHDQGTFFEAPRGPKGHSSKPLKSYEVIESCSSGPYLELFARSQRPDWTSWGAEA